MCLTCGLHVNMQATGKAHASCYVGYSLVLGDFFCKISINDSSKDTHKSNLCVLLLKSYHAHFLFTFQVDHLPTNQRRSNEFSVVSGDCRDRGKAKHFRG